MKNWVLFHRADLDGRASGAIMKRFLEDENEKFELVGLDYGDEFDESVIKKGDKVFMVDFTLQPFDRIKDLKERADIIVYDHHKSAEDPLKEMEIAGEYGEGKKAGCEIVWENVMDKKTPEIIKLLSDFQC